MRARRLILGSSLITTSLLLAVACGGSDSGNDLSGGDGTAGSGTAGSSTGGKGGGTGGSSTGGKGGTAGGTAGGAAGAAGGSGGSTSGAGGATGGAAGKGGAGGAAGTGGTAGAAGTGGATCGLGKADCDGKPDNGCESTLASDAANCGMCGKKCATAMNADGVCVSSACKLACQNGFAACDGNIENGCEVNTATDVNNCGVCKKVCPTGPNGTPACLKSACGFDCKPGYADCNGMGADGCESQPASDPNNCGLCGKQCTGKCVNGACECSGTSASATPIPLDMYVMLDKSGSMLQVVSGAQTRWDIVKSSLGTFFGSPSSKGITVGLQYFPLQDPNGTSCDDNYYYSPAVAMGVLPGTGNAQVNALTQSMANTTPVGGTPTNVALKAALKYASDYKKLVPTHTVVVVLATDGEPGDGCGATIANSAAEAMTGASGNPKIPTYVIGVGSNLTNLDTIAAAGGTSKAFIVNDGSADAFIAALKSIQLKAVGCEYAVPTPPNGGTVDPTKVNVQYTPGGGAAQVLSNVASAAACGAAGGWYYDNPTKPTKITLCASTCTTAQADANAKVDIILGCDTKKD